MKGKLHKMVSGYILSLNGDIDDPYAIVNEELAKDYEWYKLSLKNCESIERGYDLDELAYDYSWNHQSDPKWGGTIDIFKAGFQKALEVNADKRFTLKEMVECWNRALEFQTHKETLGEYIKSLKQTEWDVEIIEECLDKNCDGVNRKGECITTGKPKLDEEGCLILKKL